MMKKQFPSILPLLSFVGLGLSLVLPASIGWAQSKKLPDPSSQTKEARGRKVVLVDFFSSQGLVRTLGEEGPRDKPGWASLDGVEATGHGGFLHTSSYSSPVLSFVPAILLGSLDSVRAQKPQNKI